MKAVVITAFVISVIMMIVGVSQGLQGNHGAAVPAIVISLLALAIGVILGRE